MENVTPPKPKINNAVAGTLGGIVLGAAIGVASPSLLKKAEASTHITHILVDKQVTIEVFRKGAPITTLKVVGDTIDFDGKTVPAPKNLNALATDLDKAITEAIETAQSGGLL